MENASKLIVNIQTIGLESQEIMLCYRTGPLEKIDRETYLYRDAKQFFVKKKVYLTQQLKRLSSEQKTIPFIDMELAAKGIYIEHENRKISPLFQTISYRGTKIELMDYIKHCLRNGQITWLYQQDKINSQNPEYESIFTDLPQELLLRLEWNQVTDLDISTILTFLKPKNRFFSIIRHLLANSVVLNIPLKEENYSKEGPIRQKETHWLPYKD